MFVWNNPYSFSFQFHFQCRPDSFLGYWFTSATPQKPLSNNNNGSVSQILKFIHVSIVICTQPNVIVLGCPETNNNPTKVLQVDNRPFSINNRFPDVPLQCAEVQYHIANAKKCWPSEYFKRSFTKRPVPPSPEGDQ